jgi:hypothetical protein
VKIIELFYKLRNFFKKNKEFFTELKNNEEIINNKLKNQEETELISENSKNLDP